MAPIAPYLSIKTTVDRRSQYTDSRFHGYPGPTRAVRLARATPPGGGSISKSEDGVRCAVAGKESLRIIRLTDSEHQSHEHHKSSTGRGGHRIEASRNFWEGSGLKVDSASTDVAWGHSSTSNKILTSSRNGELIMWDLNKAGSTKYERRTKDHTRSINKVSISPVVSYYSVTVSADGDMRVWDLRDMTKSILRVHHPMGVRSAVFSPCVAHPLQAIVGLDNGSIYRWDLKMGAKGQLDRILLAHTASVTSLDWCSASGSMTNATANPEATGNNLGWLASSSLDRTVLVWDLSGPDAATHMPHKPTYELHPSFPIRRVHWRPSYGCELAVISNTEFASGSNPDVLPSTSSRLGLSSAGLQSGEIGMRSRPASLKGTVPTEPSLDTTGDPIEIWDVRRSFIAKWRVCGSAVEGGVTDMIFGSSDCIWAQHQSGAFSQLDLRESYKSLDIFSSSRVSTSWSANGTLAFVSDRPAAGETPYDDIEPHEKILTENKIHHKALGDLPYAPFSQALGMYHLDDSLASLGELSTEYVLTEKDRPELCKKNALAAFAAGQIADAQTWLLLGAALTDIAVDSELPPSGSVSEPLPLTASPMSQSTSAPAHLSNYTFPPDNTPVIPQRSPLHKSALSLDNNGGLLQPRTSSQRRRGATPNSSNSPSPVQLSSPLPSTPLPSSILAARRPSSDASSGPSHTRRSSVYRRPSAIRMDSLVDRSSSSSRHVGEGALDDSDSSSDEMENGGMSGSGDEEPNLHPLISPALGPVRAGSANPSPLSRLVSSQSRQWVTEDEDDSSSDPSPLSTESDSDDSVSPRKRAKSGSRTRRPIRIKSRSRSSTVASLAAAPPRTEKALTHQVSQNSIRTVTAIDPSIKNDQHGGLDKEETIRDLASSTLLSGRSKSRGWPTRPMARHNVRMETYEKTQKTDPPHLTERHPEIMRADEKKFRNLAFDAVRTCLDMYADQGNVQMCAMLSIVAREELRITKRQAERFVEAYLELLMRSRFHTYAAYVRKNCGLRDLQELGSAETVLYTSCSRCRKPLLQSAGAAQVDGKLTKGGFSFCLACRKFSKCSICHLPVHTLLFQCSVCGHGGHQMCYRDYYLSRPLVDLPEASGVTQRKDPERMAVSVEQSEQAEDGDDAKSSSVTSASSHSAPTITTDVDGTHLARENTKGMLGHLCAAGCGHYCWVVLGDKLIS